jgi:hypothetical protein
MLDLESTRTVEVKKLFLTIANQELAPFSPTIHCGRTAHYAHLAYAYHIHAEQHAAEAAKAYAKNDTG